MRIDLQPDPAPYVKQVADLRRFINQLDAQGGQSALTGRLMTAALIPLLPQLRTELRADNIDAPALLTATGDLIGNIAMTLVQSMFDAPPEAQAEAIDRILAAAKANTVMTIENDARMARDTENKAKGPQLSVVNGGKPS